MYLFCSSHSLANSLGHTSNLLLWAKYSVCRMDNALKRQYNDRKLIICNVFFFLFLFCLPRELDTTFPAALGSPGRENSRVKLSAYCHCIVFSIRYPSLHTVFLYWTERSIKNDFLCWYIVSLCDSWPSPIHGNQQTTQTVVSGKQSFTPSK